MKFDQDMITQVGEAIAAANHPAGCSVMFSGQVIDYRNFDESMIDLTDIVRGLHRTYRYNGQTNRKFSVLEHTLIGARLAKGDPELVYECLMHDMSETYVGDMVAPLKEMMIEFGDIEAGIAGTIFNYWWPGNDLVHYGEYTRSRKMEALDRLMYICENRHFRPHHVGSAELPKEIHDEWLEHSMAVREHLYAIGEYELFDMAFMSAQEALFGPELQEIING